MMPPNVGHNKNGVGMDNEYFASIKEVSKRLSVPAYTLRYWEKQFPVAIRPTTGAGGRRYYRAETIDRLVIIRDLLYKHGMTIAGVKKLLRDGNFPASSDEFISASNDGGTQSVMQAQPDVSPKTNTNAAQIDTAISMLEQACDLLKNV